MPGPRCQPRWQTEPKGGPSHFGGDLHQSTSNISLYVGCPRGNLTPYNLNASMHRPLIAAAAAAQMSGGTKPGTTAYPSSCKLCRTCQRSRARPRWKQALSNNRGHHELITLALEPCCGPECKQVNKQVNEQMWVERKLEAEAPGRLCQRVKPAGWHPSPMRLCGRPQHQCAWMGRAIPSDARSRTNQIMCEDTSA